MVMMVVVTMQVTRWDNAIIAVMVVVMVMMVVILRDLFSALRQGPPSHRFFALNHVSLPGLVREAKLSRTARIRAEILQ